MDWFTGFVAFFMIWWTALFAVLPWGNSPEDKPQEANLPAAPAQPRIKLKFLITTGISIVLWCILYILIEMEIIDFFNTAQQMMIEDKVE